MTSPQTTPQATLQAITLIDGLPGDSIPVSDRGLSYGDGLFETIFVDSQGPQFYHQHLLRLAQGCARLAIGYQHEMLMQEVTAILAMVSARPAILKVLLTRGGTTRGYRPDTTQSARRIVTLSVAASDPEPQQRLGVAVRSCQTPLAINPLLAGIKHLNRLENVLARGEWSDPAIAEGLLLDSAGQLIEGTMSNVFLVENGIIVTPDLSGSGVAGILRDVIINRCAAALQLTVKVEPVQPDRLYSADEIWVCNSVIGIWPVVKVDSRSLSIGPVTRRLQQSVSRFNNV
ncbi:MAG: 4-amino-4-deoxychorismate lyase [Paraglaciecola psychrophila]